MFYCNTNYVVPGVERKMGFFPSFEIAKSHVLSLPAYLRPHVIIAFRKGVKGFPPLEMTNEVKRMFHK